MSEKAKAGDPNAFQQLIQFGHYLKLKSIKVGDNVMISKHVGVTFHDNQGGEELTMLDAENVIGVVINE